MGKHPPFAEVQASRPDYDADKPTTWSKVPEPDFKPGGGLNGTPQAQPLDPRSARYRSIKPEEHDKGEIYRMMISAITPRPVAFMSTMGSDGSCNLAPMSYFNMVAHDPPTIMVSIQTAPGTSSKPTTANTTTTSTAPTNSSSGSSAGLSAGSDTSVPPKNPDGLKDTNSKIRQTGEFCCSIISTAFLEAMNYSSVDAPYGVDEWALSGLTKRPSEVVKPPHVAESAFSMECTLTHWYDVNNDAGVATNTVVLGRVRRFHVNDYVFSGDELKLDYARLSPIARLGGITFGRVLDLMELPRPVWANVGETDEVRAALEQGRAKDCEQEKEA